mgnify:CR=1 FL=1
MAPRCAAAAALVQRALAFTMGTCLEVLVKESMDLLLVQLAIAVRVDTGKVQVARSSEGRGRSQEGKYYEEAHTAMGGDEEFRISFFLLVFRYCRTVTMPRGLELMLLAGIGLFTRAVAIPRKNVNVGYVEVK